MISEIHNCTELESPSPQAAQSLLMIVTTRPDENFDNFSQQVRKYNKQQPFNFTEPEIFNKYVRVSGRPPFRKLMERQRHFWIGV